MALIKNALFQRVVAASGLASVIAAPAIQRALLRVGVDPSTMTTRDLDRALPSIEASLGVYLPPARVAEQLQALRNLTRIAGPTNP